MALLPVRKITWYKISIVLLYFGFACLTAGMVSPYWTYGSKTTADDTIVIHRGLWHVCHGHAGSVACASSLGDPPEWLKAVVALQCLAVVGLAFSAGFVVLLTCLWSFSRIPEVVACVASVVGFIGLLVFVGKTPKEEGTVIFHFSWSFALDLIGCVVAFVAAVIMALSNKNTPPAVKSSSQDTRDIQTVESINSEYAAHRVV